MKRSFETVELIREKYSDTSEFYFSIFRYASSIEFTKDVNLVKLLLCSDEFLHEYPDFFPLNENALDRTSELDRYELEGSLISMLMQGTCTDTIVSSEEEARCLISKLLTELKVNGNDITAYRFDDPYWSSTVLSATCSRFYVIYQCLHRYWIFIGFADFY